MGEIAMSRDQSDGLDDAFWKLKHQFNLKGEY